MHNKWNSANVDQVLLRKGEEHLLYRGPEGSVVRNDHLVMSDIADGPALAALLRRLGLEVPDSVALLYELRQAGLDVPLDVLTCEDCAQALAHILPR